MNPKTLRKSFSGAGHLIRRLLVVNVCEKALKALHAAGLIHMLECSSRVKKRCIQTSSFTIKKGMNLKGCFRSSGGLLPSNDETSASHEGHIKKKMSFVFQGDICSGC